MPMSFFRWEPGEVRRRAAPPGAARFRGSLPRGKSQVTYSLGMVLQVLAYARAVVDHRYAHLFQLRGRAHSGQQQQVGRAHRPGAKDNLVPFHHENVAARFYLHAHRSFALEQQPDRVGNWVRTDRFRRWRAGSR